MAKGFNNDNEIDNSDFEDNGDEALTLGAPEVQLPAPLHMMPGD